MALDQRKFGYYMVRYRPDLYRIHGSGDYYFAVTDWFYGDLIKSGSEIMGGARMGNRVPGKGSGNDVDNWSIIR